MYTPTLVSTSADPHAVSDIWGIPQRLVAGLAHLRFSVPLDRGHAVRKPPDSFLRVRQCRFEFGQTPFNADRLATTRRIKAPPPGPCPVRGVAPYEYFIRSGPIRTSARSSRLVMAFSTMSSWSEGCAGRDADRLLPAGQRSAGRRRPRSWRRCRTRPRRRDGGMRPPSSRARTTGSSRPRRRVRRPTVASRTIT
jgi:hypothetical protein